jgi:hypothetical protein
MHFQQASRGPAVLSSARFGDKFNNSECQGIRRSLQTKKRRTLKAANVRQYSRQLDFGIGRGLHPNRLIDRWRSQSTGQQLPPRHIWPALSNKSNDRHLYVRCEQTLPISCFFGQIKFGICITSCRVVNERLN